MIRCDEMRIAATRRRSRRRVGEGLLAALVAVLGLGFAEPPAASAGSSFTFGTFTQANAVPLFDYRGDDGSGDSILLDPNSDNGTFQLNPAGFSNPASIPTTSSFATFFFESVSPNAAILGANGVITQDFDSSDSILVILAMTGETFLAMRGFTGTLSGTQGKQDATFSGSLNYNGTNAFSSLPLSLVPGSTLSFTLTLTDVTPAIQLVTGSGGGPATVFNDFMASDPTSVSSSVPLTYGPASVAEPGSIVSLAVGLAGAWVLARRRRPGGGGVLPG